MKLNIVLGVGRGRRSPIQPVKKNIEHANTFATDCRLICIFLCFRNMVISLEQRKMKFNLKSNLTCNIYYPRCCHDCFYSLPTYSEEHNTKNIMSMNFPIYSFKPLTPRSNHFINSPYNFDTLSSRQVMRIKKIIS